MATRKQIVAACKKRWPNDTNIDVRENNNAPTPAQREAIAANRETMRIRKDAVTELMKSLGSLESHWLKLREASQFVLDVHGDPTALEALQSALRAGNEFTDLRDELAELTHKIRNTNTHARRFSVSTWSNGSMWSHQRASGDTLDECLAKIQQEAVCV